MPILVKSTYDFMQKATMAAYDAINEEGGDPELVMGKGREDPKCGHHSWRRLADTVASETLARDDCSEQDMIFTFVWLEA